MPYICWEEIATSNSKRLDWAREHLDDNECLCIFFLDFDTRVTSLSYFFLAHLRYIYWGEITTLNLKHFDQAHELLDDNGCFYIFFSRFWLWGNFSFLHFFHKQKKFKNWEIHYHSIKKVIKNICYHYIVKHMLP